MPTNDATGCGTVISVDLIGDCASFNYNSFVYIGTLHRLDFLVVAFNSIYKNVISC